MQAVPAASSYYSKGMKILLLAVLYYVSGKMGLMLAVQPGYATVLWPPSGIAIGFMLLYGPSVWPGVLLGSFLLNSGFPESYVTSNSLAADKLAADFMVAVGSTLQAVAGRYVFKRSFGLPLTFRSVWDVVRGLFIYTALICLIAASIAVSSLYALGRIHDGEILKNAFTWWSGDFLGLVIFLPIMILGPWANMKIIWQGREFGSLPYLSLLILMIPLVMTLYAWKVSSEYIYQKNTANFEALTQESEKALRNRIQSYGLVLIGAEGLFHAADNVMQDEWKTYIEMLNVSQRLPGIRSIGYIEKVAADDLDEFVAKRRQDGSPAFAVHPSTDTADLFIVKYTNSQVGNYAALGLNIAFEKNRYAAALKSRDTGKATITKRISLLVDVEKAGFLLMEPLYKDSMPLETPEQRRAALQGWIYASFIGQYIMKDLTQSQGDTINLKVYDGTDVDEKNLIFNSAEESTNVGPSAYQITKTLTFMEEPWTLVWTSTAKLEKATHNLAPTIIVVGGICFTLLFGVFVIFINFRTQIVANLVQVKTREISSNENRLKLLIRNMPAAVAMFDRNMNYIMTSDRWLKDYSISGSDIIGRSHYDVFPEIKKNDPWLEHHQRALHGETLSLEEDYWTRGDGSVEWLKWALHPWVDSDGQIGGIVMFTELITERKENELRSNLLKEIIVDAANLSSLESIFASIVHNICIDMKWSIGHVLFWDADHELYESSHIWFFEDDTIAGSGFKRRVSEATYRLGDGLQGKAALRKKPAYIKRLYADIDYIERDALSEVGVKSALIIPVVVKNKVSAIIEFYSSYEISEEKIPLDFYDMAGLQISRLIEKKMAEQALQESKRLNEAILSSAEYMIIATDRQGDIVLFNKQAEKMLGYTEKEVLNKPFSKEWLTRSEFQKRYEQALIELGEDIRPDFDLFSHKAIRYGVYEDEWIFIRKNHVRFPVKLSVTPIKDSDGIIVGYLAIGEDITQWKIQQEQLKQSEETFRSALQSASIGMGLLDTSGKWLVVNKAICNLLGYTEREFLATDFQSITHPEDLGIDLEYVEKLLKGEIESYQLEKRYYHKNGKIIWGFLSVGLVRQADGLPKYFISQIQDVTERREVDRIKSEFISIVSHELRTPLTSIRGSLSLLEGTMAKEIPEKALRLVTLAHKNSERLIVLINDILDLEKISAGKMRFDMKEENIISLIAQAVESMQSYAQKLGVKLELKSMPSSASVMLDHSRFQQVLANILSNALKFSPPGESVEIGTVIEGDEIIVSVRDKGIGIASEYHEKIFDKFFQIDSSITRSKNGTGLGLHISREIVEQMNGNIGLVSAPGKGTEFWIRFPLTLE